MIFNYSGNNQFATNLTVKDENVEVVHETKLLGTIVTNNLSWNRNTEELVKDANKRMRLLQVPQNTLQSYLISKQFILLLFKLDHSSVVWHSGISKRNRKSMERIQKAATKVILENKVTYEDALKHLNLDSLDDRRSKFSLRFAKNCIRNGKVRNMFPININRTKIISYVISWYF